MAGVMAVMGAGVDGVVDGGDYHLSSYPVIYVFDVSICISYLAPALSILDDVLKYCPQEPDLQQMHARRISLSYNLKYSYKVYFLTKRAIY
jgi:hypothetical protein